MPTGGNRDGCKVTAHVIRSGPLAVGIRFELVEGNPELAGVRSTVDLVFPVFKSWVEVDWRVDDPQGKLAGLGAQLDMNLDEPTRICPRWSISERRISCMFSCLPVTMPCCEVDQPSPGRSRQAMARVRPGRSCGGRPIGWSRLCSDRGNCRPTHVRKVGHM